MSRDARVVREEVFDDVRARRVDLLPYGGVEDGELGRERPREAVMERTEPRVCVLRP
jgi:hypothetical protein